MKLKLFLLCSLFALCSRNVNAQVVLTPDTNSVRTTVNSGIKAFALVQQPGAASVGLYGSASVDARTGSYIRARWALVTGGPMGTIETPDSLSTRVFGLKPGVYKYRLIITDRRIQKYDTSYTTITVLKNGN